MTGSLRASAPGEYGSLRLVSGTLAFNAASVDLESLAAGDVVVRAWVEVTTAFNAATTNTISLGNGATAGKFLSAVAAGAAGVVPAGGTGPHTAETVAGTLRATYAQSGAAATAGAARVYALVTSAPA